MTAPWKDPFGNPFPGPKSVQILWDYTTEIVVGEGHEPTLFDTLWTYTYRPGNPALPWVLSRFPGDVFYKQEEEVPELVRLAVMVAT